MLDLTVAVFVLFVCGEKLLLNHKMNKPLPWYVVLSLYSPSASKLSSVSHLPSASSQANVHFSDNFSALSLYNSIQHTTEDVYSQNIISYIISYHIISYHIISYHIISYHIISFHIIPSIQPHAYYLYMRYHSIPSSIQSILSFNTIYHSIPTLSPHHPGHPYIQ